MDSAAAFEETARRFCALAESLDDRTAEEAFRLLREILPALYASAWHLPGKEVQSVELGKSLAQDEWRQMYESFERLVGRTPMPSAVRAKVADGLADTYRDLSGPLADLDAGVSASDARWDWYVTFLAHWGQHVAYAISALHDTFVSLPQGHLGPHA